MNTQLKMKKSTLKQHYWGDTGVYQKEYDKLYNDLVPARDMAETIHGELIRSISRLYYDFCNNGNCNALEYEDETCDTCDGEGYQECRDCEGDGYYYDDEDERVDCDCEDREDCYSCDGECRIDGDIFITSYYKEMMDFLKEYISEDLYYAVEELEEWMLNTNKIYKYDYTDKEMNKYDAVADAIVYQCLTEENKPNPYFKKEEAK